jgi:hypothetical protein
MIWTYLISLILALAWFVVFRYVAVREHSHGEYQFIEISRGMMLLSVILLLVPIVNILYFIIAPIAFLVHLDSESWGIRLQARENDTFSESVKSVISWLKGSAFILFLFLFSGCCEMEEASSKLPVMNKLEIGYRYSEESKYASTENIRVVFFKQNDHDMIYYEGYDHNFCIIHSPDCSKCKNKESVSTLDWNW